MRSLDQTFQAGERIAIAAEEPSLLCTCMCACIQHSSGGDGGGGGEGGIFVAVEQVE